MEAKFPKAAQVYVAVARLPHSTQWLSQMLDFAGDAMANDPRGAALKAAADAFAGRTPAKAAPVSTARPLALIDGDAEAQLRHALNSYERRHGDDGLGALLGDLAHATGSGDVGHAGRLVRGETPRGRPTIDDTELLEE